MQIKPKKDVAVAGSVLFFITLIIFGLGIITYFKPLTGATLMFFIFIMLTYVLKTTKKTLIPAILLFIVLMLLAAPEIQKTFESIPVLGIIFR